MLRAAQQHVERGVQLVLKRAGDGDGVGQVALRRRLLPEPAEEAEECLPGVWVAGEAPRDGDEVTKPGGDHRLEQLFLGGEMAVDRPRADPGHGGDLVEGNAVAGRGERVLRRAQDLVPVALRVGAQRPVSHGG